MDRVSNVKIKKIILWAIGITILLIWLCIQIGDPRELQAIEQAVHVSLEKEGIQQEDIARLRVVHYAGLSASSDPNRRYSVEVSLWNEDQYRWYEWKSGTAADKSQGVSWHYDREK